MNIDLDTGRLIVFLSGFFIFLTVEQLFSARAGTLPLSRSATLHAGIATVTTVCGIPVSLTPLTLPTHPLVQI